MSPGIPARANPDFAERLKGLTPAQRSLLERRLMERRTADAGRHAIAPRDVNGPVPLSHAQELLWLLSQVFDDGVAYNAPGAYRLEGPLDVEVLGAALTQLVRRHEILRTTYAVVDGQPVQVLGEPRPVEPRVIDLQSLDGDAREDEIQRILKEESGFAFDLE